MIGGQNTVHPVRWATDRQNAVNAAVARTNPSRRTRSRVTLLGLGTTTGAGSSALAVALWEVGANAGRRAALVATREPPPQPWITTTIARIASQAVRRSR